MRRGDRDGKNDGADYGDYKDKNNNNDEYDDYIDKNNADDDNDDDDEGKENCIFHPSRRPDISNGFKSNHRNTNSNIKPQNSHFQNSNLKIRIFAFSEC